MLYNIKDPLFKNKLFSRLINKINEFEKYNKNYALYGTGKHTRQILADRNINKNNLLCIIGDTTKKFENIKVIEQDEITHYNIDCIIISSFQYQDVIYEKLKKSTFKGEVFKIYSLVNEYNSFKNQFVPLFKNINFKNRINNINTVVCCITKYTDLKYFHILDGIQKIHKSQIKFIIISSFHNFHLEELLKPLNAELIFDENNQDLGFIHEIKQLFVDLISQKTYQSLSIKESNYKLWKNISFDRLRFNLNDSYFVQKKVLNWIDKYIDAKTMLICSDNMNENISSFLRRLSVESIKVIFQDSPLKHCYYDKLNGTDGFYLVNFRENIGFLQKQYKNSIALNISNNNEITQFRGIIEKEINIMFSYQHQPEVRFFVLELLKQKLKIERINFYIEVDDNHVVSDQDYINNILKPLLKDIDITCYSKVELHKESGRTVVAFDFNQEEYIIRKNNSLYLYDPLEKMEAQIFENIDNVKYINNLKNDL